MNGVHAHNDSFPMTAKRQMGNFDRLPPAIRELLRYTVDDWCAYAPHLRVKKGSTWEKEAAGFAAADDRARRNYHHDNEVIDRRRAGESERRETIAALLARQAMRDAEARGQGRLL